LANADLPLLYAETPEQAGGWVTALKKVLMALLANDPAKSGPVSELE